MRIYRNQLFESQVSMSLTTPAELCDINLLHRNRLPARATLNPAQKPGINYQNRLQSDRILSLNGSYRFALFSDYPPEQFEQPGFDDSDWDDLDVPSMWQYRGYGEPTYPNVEYAFPFTPPNIFRVNPVGCYRRRFTVHRRPQLPRAILQFGGVDSAFYVYLNGQFVGLSKGSRLPAEFDVSDLLQEGENLLAVKVYTYCDGSYLENQDMLLASGIFRDVSLVFAPECAVWDLSLTTDMQHLYCGVQLFDPSQNARVRLTLDGKTVTLPVENGRLETVLTPENIRLWNAEQPELYDFTLELLQADALQEVHFKRIGFCESRVEGVHLLQNGKPILLKGINRHENDPDNGRAISIEQIRADLQLIKAHNINAIRTSHYPNNPAFYEICSELGIYVMDEADLETHGAYITGDQGYLSKQPEWLVAYFDRVKRMVERDKNETCINIWSVGNEYGEGVNSDACAGYLRGLPRPKPVMFSASPAEKSDFIQSGYLNVANTQQLLQQLENQKAPIMLVEYAHAMGNSPGNLANLWDVVLSNDAYVGGYVWEFRSHGKRRRNPDGSADYLYGGDFHDDNHWSNFTLDGYLTSDSTPKPTFRELKMVYAPVRFGYENGQLTLHSLRDFALLSDLTLHFSVLCDGKTVASWQLPAPAVPPRTTVQLALPIPEYVGTERFLTVCARSGGETVALQQFTLPATGEPAFLNTAPGYTGQVTRQGNHITVSGDRFRVEFADGVPVRYQKDGQLWFDEPMKFVTYRAETDNDGIVGVFPRWIGEWERARLHKMQFYCRGVTVTEEADQTTLTVRGTLTADHCYDGFSVMAEYTVSRQGLLQVMLNVLPYGAMPKLEQPDVTVRGACPYRLPRFGVCFAVDKRWDRVQWYGRGPEQNYPDAVAAAPVGVYSLPVEKLNFAFDVPQETGTRTDTRYLRLGNDAAALTIYGAPTFAFSVHPWKLQDLRAARHPSELKTAEKNYLYIDYKMRALGSASCGPNPEPELDFIPHDFRFVFALQAEEPVSEQPQLAHCRLTQQTAALSEGYDYQPLTARRNVVECNEE